MTIVSTPSKYYSPLRYPGGKASLAKYLSAIIEQNNIFSCVYIEPFAGGAGAALNLLINEHVESIIINDLDPAIYSFWYSVLNNTEQFIEKIKSIDLNIQEWKRQKDIYSNSKTCIFNRGFATFYLNRTNRSGILTGGPIGGINQQGKWKIDARFNRNSLSERIYKIGLFRRRIKLTNKHALDLLADIGYCENHFVYLDPPYVNKAKDLYLNHFTKEDHKNLANFLNKNQQLNWVLSYDNDDFIKELYKSYYSFEFNINYSADKVRTGEEVIIYSEKLDPVS